MNQFAVGVFGVLAVSAAALGQAGTGGTITSGDAVFRLDPSPTSATGIGAATGDMRALGAAGIDHVFQNWWWFRQEGVDTREFCLANATSSTFSGDTGTMTFNLPFGTATATWVVADLGDNRARVTASLAITNTTAAAVTAQVFNYHDFDLSGSVGGNLATLVGGDMVVTLPTSLVNGYYRGTGSAAYQVQAFAGLRTLLADTTVTTLGNSGLPFGPGDFTGAWQWTLNLEPNETETVVAVFGVEPPPPLGGCCVDGNCSNMTEAACLAVDGSWSATLCPAGGYTLLECTDPFEDISTMGSAGPTTDDSNVVVPIGFSFDYFGTPFTDVDICSNGFLRFGGVSSDLSPDPIPSTTDPDNILCVYWRDLNPATAGGSIQYLTTGDPGSQRFIVQWTNVAYFNSAGNRVTCQIVLFEGSNDIHLRYSALPAPGAPTPNPSIGMENVDGTVGTAIPFASIAAGQCWAFDFEAAGNPCDDDCGCDWNNSTAVDSSDFFDFLADFFAGDADYNNSGGTDSSDFFDFLACFFAGCP